MSRCTAPASRSCSTAPASPAPTARATTASGTSRSCRSCPRIRIAAPRDAERLREELARGRRRRRRPDGHPLPEGHRRHRATTPCGAPTTASTCSSSSDAQDVLHRRRRADGAARPRGRRAARGAGDRRDGRRPALGRARCQPSDHRARARSTASSSRSRTASASAASARASARILREAGVDTAVDELGLPDEFLEHAIPRADPRGRRPHARSKIAQRRRRRRCSARASRVARGPSRASIPTGCRASTPRSATSPRRVDATASGCRGDAAPTERPSGMRGRAVRRACASAADALDRRVVERVAEDPLATRRRGRGTA